MPTSPTSQSTDFSRDIIGRYVSNGLDEALRSTDTSLRPDARPFDVIVIGGGTFGSAVAQHLFFQDKAHRHRILVLEGGPYALPEHVQNLPMLGVGSPSATSIAALRAIGQDRDPRSEVWGLAWHSDVLGGFPGLAYCLGGRSLFWGGWSPQPLDSELTGWPGDVVSDLNGRYYHEAAGQIGVTQTNDFIHGPLHEALRRQLFEGIGARRVTDAVPFSQLPLHLDVANPAQAAAAAAVAGGGGTAVAVLPAVATEELLKLEAPLAVQSYVEQSGAFPNNKFSAMQLLMKASRAAYTESAGDDVKKRLMVVPNCHVIRLIPVAGSAAGWRVAQVVTNKGVIDLPPNGLVVIAQGSIESTRQALLLMDAIPQQVRPTLPVGRRLMAHLRSNLDFRVPRSALKFLDSKIKELQASALLVKGRHTFSDGTVGHFHLQITASGLDRFGTNSEAELFQKIPDIDTFDIFRAATATHVVITLRGIGEMEPQNPNSWIALDAESDEYGAQRAFVRIVPTPKDFELWDAMDKAADDVMKVFAGNETPEVLGKRRDGLGTTHHESGSLWMGADSSNSVTNSEGRLHPVGNAYIAAPALFPRMGSPNPMLSGIALSRRLADKLAAFTPFQPGGGFQALFNGADTSNWRMSTIRNQPGHDDPGRFLVVDGALESLTGTDIGLLWSTTPTPPDFILKMEWMRTRQDDNSGVFIRFPDPESKGFNNTAWVGVQFGFEVQIDETGAPDGAGLHKTGAIYAEPNQQLSQVPARPPGEWNQYEIHAKGQTYTVFLNGNQVTKFQNPHQGRGLPSTTKAPSFIGLQTHTGRVLFRNICIKAL